MSFHTENIEKFKILFESVKDKIMNFEGCKGVKLLQDTYDPSVFFTYSFWEDESHLDAYRNSPLFKDTWSKTKALFDDKAEAWSLIEQ